MILYLQKDPSETVYTGSLVEEPSGSVSVFGGRTYRFYLPLRPDTVLGSGSLRLRLNYANSGDLRIIPQVLLVDYIRDANGNWVENPNTPDEPYWRTSDPLSTDQDTSPVVWRDYVEYSGPKGLSDLATTKVVLELRVESITQSPIPSATISSDSSLQLEFRQGSFESFRVSTRADFSLARVRERIFLYSEVELKESVRRSHWLEGRVYEEASLGLYTEVLLGEHLQMELGFEAPGYLYSGQEENLLSDLSLDGMPVVGRDLLAPQALSSVLGFLEEERGLSSPPSPVPSPSLDLPQAVFAYGLPMLVSAIFGDSPNNVPGGNVDIFRPSSLYGGNYVYREDAYGGSGGEWQLPVDYEYPGDYYVSFPDPSSGSVGDAFGLYFVFVERSVGSEVFASINGVKGEVMLQRPYDPGMRITVFYWRRPPSPFDVVLRASNSLLHMPGLAGVAAATLIVT